LRVLPLKDVAISEGVDGSNFRGSRREHLLPAWKGNVGTDLQVCPLLTFGL
jgi:hypothetical protein